MRGGEARAGHPGLRPLLALCALLSTLPVACGSEVAAASEAAEGGEEFSIVGGKEEEESGAFRGEEGAKEAEEGKEGEEGEGEGELDEEAEEARAAGFTVTLGVIVVLISMVIKDLQSHREDFEADHPITFQMVEATIEECVACGAIAMCFIILRENAFVDVLAVIAQLPHVRVEEEVITEAVERIDAVIFWTLFYYFVLIVICMLWVGSNKGKWEDEEEKATTGQAKDTIFQRLRYQFFHPQVPSAGVKVASECSEFDVANLNFARYLERATAQCICEVIHLPKVVILLPLVIFVGVVAVEHFSGSESGEEAGVFGLVVGTMTIWGCLLSTLILRCDVRRIYEQVVPRNLGGRAPFYETAQEELQKEQRSSMSRMKSEQGADYTGGRLSYNRGQRSSERELTPRSRGHEGESLAQSLKRNLTMLSQGSSELLESSPTRKAPMRHVQDIHTSLFWFGTWGPGLGPRLLRTWIQGCLFSMCVCAAVTQRTFPQAFLREHWILFGLFCIPFPAILFLVLACLPEYVVASKLEVLVDEGLIEEVIAQTKTRRFVPFVGTHTGKRLVQQMKYEAVMEFYRHLSPEEVSEIVNSPDKHKAFEDLPEMEKAMLEVIFQRHDRDLSGAIDRTELQACLEEEGFSKKTAERVACDWMEIYDTDHSGYLSYEEFQMLHTVLLQEIKDAEVKPADCMAMCRRLDKNSNGKLSSFELSDAFQEWLGTNLQAKDVTGIFGSICPLPEGEQREQQDVGREDSTAGEVEIRRIAEWIYRVYEMTRAIEKSQDAMMGKGRVTFAVPEGGAPHSARGSSTPRPSGTCGESGLRQTIVSLF